MFGFVAIMSGKFNLKSHIDMIRYLLVLSAFGVVLCPLRWSVDLARVFFYFTFPCLLISDCSMVCVCLCIN